jgi:His-Xaa-Ser system protein HxsD
MERELTFEEPITSVDALQRAIYRLSDRLSCDIHSEDGKIKCTIHLVTDDLEDAEATLGDFRNEVNDQVLRERIRKETELSRNLILSLAFSQTGLTDESDEAAES